MNLIKKLLKFALATLLLLLVAGAGYYFYDEYEQKKKDDFELSYATEKKWDWHDKYDRVQFRKINDESKTVLRKVNLDKKYVIYAYKNDDYSLSAKVQFMTECKSNKEITSSKKHSNGDYKTLKCNEKGSALNYNVKWNGIATDFTWEENLDGFALRENFTYWDFSILDQEVTLSKAK
ncbi:hypothetical protein EKO29_14675 [Colwellia sp. Arc7-635]|uniref:hypothetical protein n=1 Tax=Colwellia sp. Arc7-635 TaxID=2497879 RepID=UPI000F84F694|nr:hypothetical protein [Colwellia sp. Arc7-635]AZQ85116.1 hypothetical protein EKO29_14675 [Colwellia sp. Arc7-635]